MLDFLSEYYLVIKALHIIAVISWMAGLLYLPRLFVYHTQVEADGAQDKLFQTMEHKLFKIIMTPAMNITWALGLLMAFISGVYNDGTFWFYVKLVLLILLSVFHMKLSIWMKKFKAGENEKSESFFRKINEVPTVLMMAIVILAIVKPF